jgi:hypothetical protein
MFKHVCGIFQLRVHDVVMVWKLESYRSVNVNTYVNHCDGYVNHCDAYVNYGEL